MIHDLDALLGRVGQGDRTAFAQLYDAVSGAVFGTIRRTLRDEAMSEEVAQDVLLEVWRKAPSWDPDRGKATTWILTIAHRRAVDRVRSEQAARERTEKVGIASRTVAFDATADEVTDRDEQERVRDALAGLTDLQREAIELAYYGGYTYREVSERLDVPLGTIKTRMRDGLLRLRDTLGATA